MADFDGTNGHVSLAGSGAFAQGRPLSVAGENLLREIEYGLMRYGGTDVGHAWRAQTEEETGEVNERRLCSNAWAIWHYVPAYRVTPGLTSITVRGMLIVTNRVSGAPEDVRVALELEGFGRVEGVVTGGDEDGSYAEVVLTLDLGQPSRADVSVPLYLWLRSDWADVSDGYTFASAEETTLLETPNDWPNDRVDIAPYWVPADFDEPITIDMRENARMLDRIAGLDGADGGYGHYASLRRRAITITETHTPTDGRFVTYGQERIAARRAVRALDVRPHVINARAQWTRPRMLLAGARPIYTSASVEHQWRAISLDDGGDLLNELVWLDREDGTLEVTVAVAMCYYYAGRATDTDAITRERGSASVVTQISLKALDDGDANWAGASLTPAGGAVDDVRDLVAYPTDLSRAAPPLLRQLNRYIQNAAGGTWSPSYRDGLLYAPDIGAVQLLTYRIDYTGADPERPHRVRIALSSESTLTPPPGRSILDANTWAVVVGSCVWDEGTLGALSLLTGPVLQDIRRAAYIEASPLEATAELLDLEYARRGQLGPCVHFDDVGNGFIRASSSYGTSRDTGGPGLESYRWLWRSRRVDASGDVQLHAAAYILNADVLLTITPVAGGSASTLTLSNTSTTTPTQESGEVTLTADTTYEVTVEMRRATGAGTGSLWALGIRDAILTAGDIP